MSARKPSDLVGDGPRRVNPDYGIDAPGLVTFFFASSATAAAAALASTVLLSNHPRWQVAAAVLAGIAAIYLLSMGCFMIFGSKVMKLRQRESILGLVAWRGDERVLDVGCGRGLMLVGAARKLTTGNAVGIDIWQASDQSANGPNGAADNAIIEGVSDRISVDTGDMRSLPYAGNHFDVVISHWVVHNLKLQSDRDRAIEEMIRVLRPGGYLILTDIENRGAYTAKLRSLGLTDYRLVVDPILDIIYRSISFGSFSPATHFARKPLYQ